jgi:bla regulator protein blaR1
MRSLAQLLLTLLLNAAWQVAVVTLLAAGASWLLRETAAWCRHSVWVAAILLSLFLPIISGLNATAFSPISNQRVARVDLDQTVIRPVRLAKIDRAERMSVPSQTILQVDPPVARGLISPISLNRNLAAGLLAFYTLFLLYRGFKLFRAWRRTAMIMRCTGSTQVPERAAAIIAKCQRELRVTRVRFVCSASVPVPITGGVLNPVIILPERLLNEADEEILLSAIGHELVHVARRDYILNLVYEVLYLPLSFHPAAALLRRRIRQTRELCCDELVAKKLLAPEIYARSLVRLIGSVPLAGRLASDTTIGITDADILEVRIMSLLKTSKFSTRRNTLLLCAACLLLVAPCAVAAAYALPFDIDNPETVMAQKQDQDKEAARNLDRASLELKRAHEVLQLKERELTERLRQNPNPQGEELEALRRMEKELLESSAKLSHEQQLLHLKATEELRERLAQIATTFPGDEARMVEAKLKLEQLQRSYPEQEARSRELREQLAMLEKQTPNAAQLEEYLKTLHRAQEEIAMAQEAMTQEKREKIEEKMKLKERRSEDSEEYRKELEKAAIEDSEGRSKIKDKLYEKMIRKDMGEQIRKKMEIEGGWAREQASMAQQATMSMDRAIQIAVSQHPGKVLSCNLGRKEDGGEVFYRLVIIGEGDKSPATHVWVSATDGRILKTEHE